LKLILSGHHVPMQIDVPLFLSAIFVADKPKFSLSIPWKRLHKKAEMFTECRYPLKRTNGVPNFRLPRSHD